MEGGPSRRSTSRFGNRVFGQVRFASCRWAATCRFPDLVPTTSVKAELHLRRPSIGPSRRFGWIFGPRASCRYPVSVTSDRQTFSTTLAYPQTRTPNSLRPFSDCQLSSPTKKSAFRTLPRPSLESHTVTARLGLILNIIIYFQAIGEKGDRCFEILGFSGFAPGCRSCTDRCFVHRQHSPVSRRSRRGCPTTDLLHQ